MIWLELRGIWHVIFKRLKQVRFVKQLNVMFHYVIKIRVGGINLRPSHICEN